MEMMMNDVKNVFLSRLSPTLIVSIIKVIEENNGSRKDIFLINGESCLLLRPTINICFNRMVKQKTNQI